MKKKVSKLAAVMLILVMAAVVFTGCGQNSTQNTTEESTTTSKAYESQDIKVAALKGPTAIGMVKLMNDNEDKKTANNYTFQIEAAADAFTADLIKGDVQIAAMPCNAAATLYNKSQGKVSVVGINTLGVLYILDNKGEIKSVADLKGKTIYTTGKGTTPEYTLRYLLSSNGIDPDKDVTIEFKSEATEVATIMASAKEETIAMLPQPFATTVLMNNQDVKIALDVTAEWEKSANGCGSIAIVSSFAEAIIVATSVASDLNSIVTSLSGSIPLDERRYLNVYSGVVPLPVVYIVFPLRSATDLISPLLSSIYNTPSVLIPTTETFP